jgi:hypothetical protein
LSIRSWNIRSTASTACLLCIEIFFQMVKLASQRSWVEAEFDFQTHCVVKYMSKGILNW